MSRRSAVSSSTTRLLPVLSLSILLVLTGCIGLIFDKPQERPVTVVVDNSANTTFTFKVSVVEIPANVTTRRDGAPGGTGPIGQGGGTHEPGANFTFTAVELPESAYLHGRYTLKPGEEEERTNISPSDFASERETFPRRFAVVVVVYHNQNEDEIIEYATVNCDEADLTGLEVTSRHIKAYPDISLAFNCGY